MIANPLMRKLPLSYPTELSKQAEEFVRNLIGTGQLAEGMRLPSTMTLARQWGIPGNNVHVALAGLVKDGLLVRQRGKGTFVCRRPTELKAVAVYTIASSIANPESNLHRVILSEVLRQLAVQQMETHVIVDPRADEDLHEPLPSLMQLTRTNRVGAVIATCPRQKMKSWLSKLRHLAAFGEDEHHAWAQVAIDFRQMTDVCLQALAAQGCRSVGFISGLPVSLKFPDSKGSDRFTFQRYFTHQAETLGLQVLSDWSVTMQGTDAWKSFQEAGYSMFRTLWSRGTKPDGLFVYPDSYMPGIFLAMTELGVRAPVDLRLAYHRNERTPLFSPFPTTEAVLSEQAIASALIAEAKTIGAGGVNERILIPVRIESRMSLL